jgi:hypothetical protein
MKAVRVGSDEHPKMTLIYWILWKLLAMPTMPSVRILYSGARAYAVQIQTQR